MNRKLNSKRGKVAARSRGMDFERAVARIQQMMDVNSVVTHNEKLKDRVGNIRQFDVVIRGHFGGRPVLGVMECKDHKRKKGPDTIEAFSKKSENLGANLRIVVSRLGFTKQALLLAKHENIGCLSLVTDDADQIGFSIGDMWYGVIRRWENFRLHIKFALPTAPIAVFDSSTVKWKGKRVQNFFVKQFLTTCRDEKGTENMTITTTFDQPRMIEIDGFEWPVAAIACTAERVVKVKRQWVRWSGDALFDWHTNQMMLAPGGSVFGSAVETDLETWPDYGGLWPVESEQPGQSFLVMTIHSVQKWNESSDIDVPDLDAL